jgi:alcohol dehydrogenase
VCPDDVEDSNAVIMLAEYVRQKIAKINIPSRLKELSLSIEQLTRAVEDCGDLDIINHLPRSMTTDDLFEIIKQAY